MTGLTGFGTCWWHTVKEMTIRVKALEESFENKSIFYVYVAEQAGVIGLSFKSVWIIVMRANYLNRSVSAQAYWLGLDRNVSNTKTQHSIKTGTGSRRVKRSTVKSEVCKLIETITLCAEHRLHHSSARFWCLTSLGKKGPSIE